MVIGGKHVRRALLPCNKQSEAASRGCGETKLLSFHSWVCGCWYQQRAFYTFSLNIACWFVACLVTKLLPPAFYLSLPLSWPSRHPPLPLASLPSPDLPNSCSNFLIDTSSLCRYSCTYHTIPIFLSSVFPLKDLVQQQNEPCMVVVMKSLPGNPPDLV